MNENKTDDKQEKSRGTYIPLAEEKIEQLRAKLLNCASHGWLSIPDGIQVGILCDMAINSLLYAGEINRLREAPSARGSIPVPRETLEQLQHLLLCQAWVKAEKIVDGLLGKSLYVNCQSSNEKK